MYVCMYICMYVCVCMYVCICIYMGGGGMAMQVFMFVYMHMNMFEELKKPIFKNKTNVNNFQKIIINPNAVRRPNYID